MEPESACIYIYIHTPIKTMYNIEAHRTGPARIKQALLTKACGKAPLDSLEAPQSGDPSRKAVATEGCTLRDLEPQ